MTEILRFRFVVVLLAVFIFGFFTFMESMAWARAGRGGSSGSRGSRSYSTPSSPSAPSSSSPYSRSPGSAYDSSPGFFSRSPFLQGMAGGLAGGFIGNMLFGGRGYASPGGGMTGGGIGLMDIAILGLLAYFGWRFFKRRREAANATAYYSDMGAPRMEGTSYDSGFPNAGGQRAYSTLNDVRSGLEQIRQLDPSFNEEAFRETSQDLFFRIQAGWMNRSLDGIQNLLTEEMSAYFAGEFDLMKQQGRINRLENIAVRKVEATEAWQETGKEYITVLFTANLLDYTVDDKTEQVVEGDRLNPVKFQEYWTFCRDIGVAGSGWKLSAINQLK